MQYSECLKKCIFSGVSLVLALSLLLSGCAGKAVTKNKIGTRTQSEPQYTERQYHLTDTGNLIYVVKSGLIELYFDSVTYGVGVRQTNTDKTWLALPAGTENGTGLSASVVTVQVSGGDTLYTLNSQDNAVAFGSASFKPTETGLQVTYDMALDSDTANSAFDALPEGALYVSATVNYTLEDGALRVKVNCGDMLVSSGYTVETLTLLDYFGATGEEAAEGDYILVPDGGGAVELTAGPLLDDYESRTFVSYGTNLALGDTQQNEETLISSASSILPAYGMKCGESAFAALIESGDAISEIREYRCKGTDTYNRVGTTFLVTDAAVCGDEDQTLYLGTPYTGEVGICYRFLSDKNASYSGMAAACRELLIRNGVLSTKTVVNTDYLPFMLTVQAAAAKNISGSAVFSDYAQTLELLKLMKAKGINNVFLRYNGVLEGANAQELLKNSSPASCLGSKKDFEALAQYVSTQQFTMYLNIDILTSSKKDSDTAENLFGKAESFTQENPFAEYAGKETQKRFALSLSALDTNVNSFINTMQNYDFGGYCIDDAGSLLYADYSDTAHSRWSAVNLLTTQATTLSAGRKLMVDTGNIYMLKNADAAVSLPSETVYPETDSYYAVPFVQMVLHGIVDYALVPANLSEDCETAFLKSVEYGALPSYMWICTKTGSEAIDALYHYENQINRAAEQYNTANGLLYDLRDARMTAHEQVQAGVYRTEYNNSTVLYFNYNDTAVTVNSITVEPMSCIRVN